MTPRLVAATGAVAAAILLPAVALASSAGSDSAGARTAGSAPTVASADTAGATGRCVEGYLTDWIGVPGSYAAGSTYYDLEFSDTSSAACTLYGFPGVSALGPGGAQRGSAAGRSSGYTEHVVTLKPGGTAHVIVQIVDVGNYSRSACRPAAAAALRVYAPGAYSAKWLPFSFRACSRKGPVYLKVSPVLAGTGIPGY